MVTQISEEPSDPQINTAVGILKLLADGTRLRILWALLHSEHSVNELASHLGVPAAGVSQHLAKLRLGRLVRTRREGTRIFYSAEDLHVRQVVEDVLLHADHGPASPPGHRRAPWTRRDRRSGGRYLLHRLAEGQVRDPFPPPARRNDTTDRRDANRAVGVSAIGLGLTGLLELTLALLSGSVSLLGDALHNLSDVSTSAVVFLGFRLSRRPATDTHPYGWDRAEDIAGLGVALVIWASAVFAGFVSVHKLLEHGRTSHVGFAMAAAVVGILGNQVVARYKLRVGKRILSATLVADAQHSWLDALSSAGALFGLIGVAVGLRWADAVAGLLVTAFIVHVGWEVTGDLLAHLMDSVDPEVLAVAVSAAEEIAGVEHAHARARWMGRSLIVEVEGFADPAISLMGAEGLGDEVEAAVIAAVPECRSVLWTPRPSAPATGG